MSRKAPAQAQGALDFYKADEKDSDHDFDDVGDDIAVEEDVPDRREVLNT